ncbi:MAG: TIGR00341 family protein [Spirochaetota bacterium]
MKKQNNELNPEKVKDSLPQKFKSMVDTVIKPEERTMRNYVNINFWRTKYDEYKKIREKEKEDFDVYESLSHGARPTIEYYLLTILSCLIATAGLMQNSPAVIIGAMIVAPLMTPILSFSLGVIWGDTLLIKTSFGSIVKGTLLAIFISGTLAFFVPIAEYTSEILARTKPNLFDIVIAISSGLVGAYGNANRKISNTLVGIAIAVALMPPLCTIGIGIGNFDWHIARGALILFSINLISISLAGAIIFWIMKIHPISKEEKAKVTRRALSQIIISVILLTIISIPVGIYTYRTFVLEHAKKMVWETAKKYFGTDVFAVQFDENQGKLDVIIIVLSQQDDESLKQMQRIKSLYPDFGTVKIKFIKTASSIND